MVAAADKAHFHPTFLKELEEGKQIAASKKAADLRQKEILQYCSPSLLKLIVEDAKVWLANASIAMVGLAILKTGSDPELKEALVKICQLIVQEDWKVKSEEAEVAGIEHPGLHMMLKKLALNDDAAAKIPKTTFGECLVSIIDEEAVRFSL